VYDVYIKWNHGVPVMRIAQLVLACCSVLFAAFCGFGFLASFEPVPHALAWKVGYAALAVASLAAAGHLALAALRGRGPDFGEPGARRAH
jgi:hypothetical protein